jgi:hypothetical protein
MEAKYLVTKPNVDISITNKYFDECATNRRPYIIVTKSKSTISKIEWDLSPLFEKNKLYLFDYFGFINSLYKLYIKEFNFPTKEYKHIGGLNFGVLTVFTIHSEIIAEKLYSYLMVLREIDLEKQEAESLENSQGVDPKYWPGECGYMED